jgi:hypothetical protein
MSCIRTSVALLHCFVILWPLTSCWVIFTIIFIPMSSLFDCSSLVLRRGMTPKHWVILDKFMYRTSSDNTGQTLPLCRVRSSGRSWSCHRYLMSRLSLQVFYLCIVDSAAIYIMVVKFRNTISPSTSALPSYEGCAVKQFKRNTVRI